MKIVDQTGYPLRVGQKVRVVDANYEATVLEVNPENYTIRQRVYWIKLDGPRGRHEELSMYLDVIAPQPLEWVKASECPIDPAECDNTGDVYIRMWIDGEWMYGLSRSNKGMDFEWLRGVKDNIEFQVIKGAVRRMDSGDVRQVEL